MFVHGDPIGIPNPYPIKKIKKLTNHYINDYVKLPFASRRPPT